MYIIKNSKKLTPVRQNIVYILKLVSQKYATHLETSSESMQVGDKLFYEN